jgi:hypothetical protein
MNINYKQKYLKYKTKYNHLKNIQEGGLETGELRAYFLTQDQLKFCIENREVKSKIDSLDKTINALKQECKKHETKVEKHGEKPWYRSTVKHVLIGEKKEATKSFMCHEDRTNKYNTEKTKEQQNLYNGEYARCNINRYGENLYKSGQTVRTKFEKIMFKLDYIAPYCIQEKKYIYTYDKNIKSMNKKNLSDEFDYLNSEKLKSIYSEAKYIIIARCYKTSPDILIALYKKEEDTFNYITPSSDWNTFKQTINLQ